MHKSLTEAFRMMTEDQSDAVAEELGEEVVIKLLTKLKWLSLYDALRRTLDDHAVDCGENADWVERCFCIGNRRPNVYDGGLYVYDEGLSYGVTVHRSYPSLENDIGETVRVQVLQFDTTFTADEARLAIFRELDEPSVTALNEIVFPSEKEDIRDSVLQRSNTPPADESA